MTDFSLNDLLKAFSYHASPRSFRKVVAVYLRSFSTVDAKTGCWLWQRGLDRYGYARLTVAYKYRRAHRLAWLLFVGPIPKGLYVLHTCDVRHCINPQHLFLGTNLDNIRDMERKGRARRLERVAERSV